MSLAQPDDHMVIPRLLPDGSVVMDHQAADAVDELRRYDPRCSLVRNTVAGRWEIWRRNEDGSQSKVGSMGGARVPHPSVMVRQLAEHDTRRGYDPVADIFAADERRRKADSAALEESIGDGPDKLHWALSKDLGLAAARPIPLSGRRT